MFDAALHSMTWLYVYFPSSKQCFFITSKNVIESCLGYISCNESLIEDSLVCSSIRELSDWFSTY